MIGWDGSGHMRSSKCLSKHIKKTFTYFHYRKVYLTSLGFAAVALILSFFAGNVRHLMTSNIAVHMEGDQQVHQHNHKESMLARDAEAQSNTVVHNDQTISHAQQNATAHDDKALERSITTQHNPEITK
jgi:hypothetical protein